MRKIDASLFDELREQFVKLDMTGDGMCQSVAWLGEAHAVFSN